MLKLRYEYCKLDKFRVGKDLGNRYKNSKSLSKGKKSIVMALQGLLKSV